MTDRELLEAAAKTIGLADARWCPSYECVRFGGDASNPRDGRVWNPLTDDGDALRLAVKLRMALDVDEYGLVAFCGQGFERDVKGEQIDGDPYAATRRAIVRAAAVMAAD